MSNISPLFIFGGWDTTVVGLIFFFIAVFFVDGPCLIGRASNTVHGIVVALAILAHFKNGQQLATNFHAAASTTKMGLVEKGEELPNLVAPGS